MRKILLVCGSPMARFGLDRLFGEVSELLVVGDSAEGEKGLALANELRPDLVILGLDLSGELSGMEVCVRLKAAPCHPKVLVYTDRALGETASRCLVPEADSWVYDGSSCRELLDAVLGTLDGRKVRLPYGLAAGPPCRTETESDVRLSVKEREVAGMILKRLSNEEIARDLHVSLATVKTHVRSILRKMGVRNRMELI